MGVYIQGVNQKFLDELF